jgi:hypothetical protein
MMLKIFDISILNFHVNFINPSDYCIFENYQHRCQLKKYGSTILSIVQFTFCFTFPDNIVMILTFCNQLTDNLRSDYNHSGCNSSDYNISLVGYVYSHDLVENNLNNSNNTDQSTIDSALSFFATGADLSATIWSQPLYYLSNFLPQYWVEYQKIGKIHPSEEQQKLNQLFYAGALLMPVSLGLTMGTVYGLPWLLSLKTFGLQPGALCFFNALSKRTLWSLVQLNVKAWLEQFYFSFDLKRYVVIPSAMCLVLSCISLFLLPQFNLPFFYMSIPAFTELVLSMNHIAWFFIIPELRNLRLLTNFPHCKEIITSFIRILRESFYVILAITPELLSQAITSFVAAQYGGSTPTNILKAQQNFYFAYLLQTSAALCMTIEVGSAYKKSETVKNKVVKDNLLASSMICFPAIIITTLFNMLINSDDQDKYCIYALGAAISIFELFRTQFLAALKVLDLNCAASVTVCVILVSAQIAQVFYGIYAKKNENSDLQVAKNLLGIQLGGAVLATLATGGLYAMRRKVCKRNNHKSDPSELTQPLNEETPVNTLTP